MHKTPSGHLTAISVNGVVQTTLLAGIDSRRPAVLDASPSFFAELSAVSAAAKLTR
jgi:hypothetical protein